MRELSATTHIRSWPGHASALVVSVLRCNVLSCCSCSSAHPAPTCKRLCFITPQSCSQTAACKPATGISARCPRGVHLYRGGSGGHPGGVPGAAAAVRGARGSLSLPFPSRRGLGRCFPRLTPDHAVLQQDPTERLHPAGSRFPSPGKSSPEWGGGRQPPVLGREGVNGGGGGPAPPAPPGPAHPYLKRRRARGGSGRWRFRAGRAAGGCGGPRRTGGWRRSTRWGQDHPPRPEPSRGSPAGTGLGGSEGRDGDGGGRAGAEPVPGGGEQGKGRESCPLLSLCPPGGKSGWRRRWLCGGLLSSPSARGAPLAGCSFFSCDHSPGRSGERWVLRVPLPRKSPWERAPARTGVILLPSTALSTSISSSRSEKHLLVRRADSSLSSF